MKRIFTILLGLSMVLYGCRSVGTDVKDETLYPSATYADGVYVWCTVPSMTNGIRYYNSKSDSVSSLCNDPICDHMNEDCVLFQLLPDSLIAEDQIVYAIMSNTFENKDIIIRYDFANQKRKDLVSGEYRSLTNDWCISGDYLYYITRDEIGQVPNVFRVPKNGRKSEQVTFSDSMNIETFRVYDGDVYNIRGDDVYRNDEFYFKIPGNVYRFSFELYDGYLYYTTDSSRDITVSDSQEENIRILESNRADVYRFPLTEGIESAECIIRDANYRITFRDGYIYYFPFVDYELAFCYTMPPDEEEYAYLYNYNNSTIRRYSLASGKDEALFEGRDILLSEINALTDKYIIAYCVPYADAEWIDEEAREVDSYFYMDNADYYKLTYDGEVVGRVGFYENERGVIK
ncbi:MAG: hypothetical protein IJA85_10710 [Clostridia bacterium]|nr:hypothetical protein [Clostridia bacterium]